MSIADRIIGLVTGYLIKFPVVNECIFSDRVTATTGEYIGWNRLLGHPRSFPFELQTRMSSVFEKLGSQGMLTRLQPNDARSLSHTMMSLVIDNFDIVNPQFATIITDEVEGPISIAWDVDDSSVSSTPVIEESTVQAGPEVCG